MKNPADSSENLDKEEVRGILEKVLNKKLAIKALPIRYQLLILMVIGLAIESQSQTTSTRGQNEINVVEFHALTDPSCTALGMDDNQEKLNTHADFTQKCLNATDTRLIGKALLCRVDQETTTTLVGSGNNYTDLNNHKAWLWNSSNGASITDIQYFYTNVSGYEELSRIGEDSEGFCRAVFSGGYDSDDCGAHAYTHVSGAVGTNHNEPRYNATYTVDLTGIGGNIFDAYDGKTNGAADNTGGTYLPFYCTPETYNKDTPANGGDGNHYTAYPFRSSSFY